MDADAGSAVRGVPPPRSTVVQAARQAVAEARQARFPFANYTLAVRQLPALLQRHGLGQTLAYLQMRAAGNPTSPFDLLTRQLDRWLLEVTGASARGALAALSTRDSRFYREAAEQVWLFVHALCVYVEER
jgi:hypothetical protein